MNAISTEGYDGIILAGGTSLRMGHDKLAARIGDHTLLDRAIGALTAARNLVVVGPRRDTTVGVDWTSEEPPGSGPAMAIRAGFLALGDSGSRQVIILAGDLPFADEAITPLLAAVTATRPAAVMDTKGRVQYLMSAWNRPVLSERCSNVKTGDRVASLFTGLEVTPVALERRVFDCNTPEDLARARLEAQARGLVR